MTAGAGWLDRGVAMTPLARVDQGAQRYYDRTLTHALGTYAAARGLNAVISVVQGSDVAVSPAGVGVRVAAGEILDPLNDLIERFSWVVLAAATSLGIQKILLTIFSWAGMRLLLPLAALVGLGAALWPRRYGRASAMAVQLLMAAMALRYLLPVTALATDRIDRLFLNDKSEQASISLTVAAGAAEAPEMPHGEAGDVTLAGKIKQFFQNIGEAAQLERRISLLKTSVTGLIDKIIDLIVIFALKTLIIPLLILWVLGRLLKRLVHMDPTALFWRRMKPSKTLLTDQ